MIFKLFSRKVCCGTCGEGFDDLEPIPIKDKKQIKQNLLKAKFHCPKCDSHFHGMCGHVGSASPTGALVTCANCNHTFQQRIPFPILKN